MKEKKRKRKQNESAIMMDDNSNKSTLKKNKKLYLLEELKKASTLGENLTHICLLTLVVIIWTNEFLHHIITSLETLISLSLKEKQLEAKRYLHLRW